VAHIKETFLPISETFVYSYLTSMEGVESHILAERAENEESFPFENRHILAEQGPVMKGVSRLVHRVTRSPKTHFLVLPRSPFASRVLKEIGADVVHAHGGYAGYRFSGLARGSTLPYLTSFYGRDIGAGSRHPYWRKAYRVLFDTGHLFLAEGPAMTEKLVAAGCPREKVRLQRIGIDLEKFPLKTNADRITGQGSVVLMCGRMVEKKGMEYGIRAFAAILKSFPEACLRVIGDGPLSGELRHLVSTLGIESSVRFMGRMSYSQYATESRKADLFLQPSVTAADGDSEGGAPTTLLEMQAMGIPVVSSLHDDIPEVVADGKSGFLLDERDVEGISDRLAFLLANPGVWEEMGREGRRSVEKRHDIRVLARQLEDLYAGLVRDGALR
jgi:colanic acid/amylovoran biosynthesis glycosyltransferase